MQNTEKNNLDYLFEDEPEQPKGIDHIISSVTESNHYSFHKFDRNKLMPGHTGSVGIQTIGNEKNLVMFNRYFNRSIWSTYNFLNNTTKLSVRQDSTCRNWIKNFMVELKTILATKGYYHHYSLTFKLDEYTLYIHNNQLDIEYEKKVDGFAFMDTYDSIRFLKELDMRFSLIKSTFRNNINKILEFYKNTDCTDSIDTATGTITGDPVFITDILG